MTKPTRSALRVRAYFNNAMRGARKLKFHSPSRREYYGSLTPSEITSLTMIEAQFDEGTYNSAASMRELGLSNPFNASLVPLLNTPLSSLLETQE